MQPELPGQDAPPAPGPQTSQPRPNVPEYLHMDPVVIQSPKSKKKPILIAAVTIIILLAAGGTFLWIKWQQNQIQQRFDGALDNLLNTTYVTRKRTVTPQDSTPVLTAAVSTDYTNSNAPKSTINYHFFPAPKSTPNVSPDFEAAGDIMVLNNKDFYGRLTTAPADLLPKNAKLDSWYAIDNPTETTLTNTANDFDYLKLRNEFNTVYGIVPFGNLSADTRTQIDSYVQTNSVYTITGTSSDKIDGKQVTVYTLTIDYPKLSDLNQKLANLLGIDSSKQILTDNGKPITIWVDNISDRIIKLSEAIGDTTHRNSATIEESYTYPSTLPINAPVDATKLP